MYQNKVDLSLLVITKGLNQRVTEKEGTKGDKGNDGNQYANKQAHVELAAKMRDRDKATAP